MATTDLLEVILSNTFIKSLALKKVVVLRNNLVNKLFKGESTPLPSQSNVEDPKIASWAQDLNPAVFSNITQANVYSTFDTLESILKAIEPLILYIPYELPEKEIVQIGTKLRSDYGPHFLIEINIDPNLIAGCALSYKGVYKDLSVKQRISDHRKEILSEFGKYIKH